MDFLKEVAATLDICLVGSHKPAGGFAVILHGFTVEIILPELTHMQIVLNCERLLQLYLPAAATGTVRS
jgi:hypothetical protein